MVTGRSISEMLAAILIRKGQYALSEKDAVGKFGLNYVAISPVYPGCLQLLEILGEGKSVNCLYVKKESKAF